MNPSDSCNSRTRGAPASAAPTSTAPTDERLALLAWLRSCPPDELRQILRELPFKRLQQLHELHEFEPPADPLPSAALSQEGRVAVLARRAEAGLSLWNGQDLIHHQGKASGLVRLGRVVSRRRNGSIAIGKLQRVDWTPPPEADEWETIAAELAADATAMRRTRAMHGLGERGPLPAHITHPEQNSALPTDAPTPGNHP